MVYIVLPISILFNYIFTTYRDQYQLYLWRKFIEEIYFIGRDWRKLRMKEKKMKVNLCDFWWHNNILLHVTNILQKHAKSNLPSAKIKEQRFNKIALYLSEHVNIYRPNRRLIPNISGEKLRGCFGKERKPIEGSHRYLFRYLVTLKIEYTSLEMCKWQTEIVHGKAKLFSE